MHEQTAVVRLRAHQINTDEVFGTHQGFAPIGVGNLTLGQADLKSAVSYANSFGG